jgi:hypothetical protein
MKKEFIPYEQALELKELGFDIECVGYYDDFNSIGIYQISKSNKIYDTIAAPLYSQAFKWFREKHQLDYWVRAWWAYDRTMFVGYEALVRKGEHCGTYEFYEEAELACLKKLIEIVKNK